MITERQIFNRFMASSAEVAGIRTQMEAEHAEQIKANHARLQKLIKERDRAVAEASALYRQEKPKIDQAWRAWQQSVAVANAAKNGLIRAQALHHQEIAQLEQLVQETADA